MFSHIFGKKTGGKSATRRARFQPQLEMLEDRQLMSGVTVNLVENTSLGDRLDIRGTNLNDTVSVHLIFGGKTLLVQTSTPQIGVATHYYDASKVPHITFFGLDGNDFFANHTTLPSTAGGGKGNDFLFGGTARDVLRGEDGDDVLLGFQGDDLLVGGRGRDHLDGGEGNDHLYGEFDGGGTVFGESCPPFVCFDTSGPPPTNNPNGDWLFGGDGNDYLDGDDGNDFLNGGRGTDILKGGGGNDQLFGGWDNDPDKLDGESGFDLYWLDPYAHLAIDRGQAPDYIPFFEQGKDSVQIAPWFF